MVIIPRTYFTQYWTILAEQSKLNTNFTEQIIERSFGIFVILSIVSVVEKTQSDIETML